MLKNNWQFKPFLLDVFAMNSFSYAVAFVVEILIAQMSWGEHFKIRLFAFIVNSVVARPYTLWREKVYQLTTTTEQDGFLKHYLVDSFVFLSFQLPIYVGSAILGGADTSEIITAAVTITCIAGLLGKPYGMYLDWLTRKAGLTLNNRVA
ncbi:L-alanine exporter AlaE [Pseudoalteromonas sp.]|uniref:L-alanine exporter AlaE n=1 Tax=Pseudoalteromonas sp. TaxID=53249 RepID=UPI00356B3281